MVSSGLPRRNGDRHICEIADMALNLLQSVKKFKVNYTYNDHSMTSGMVLRKMNKIVQHIYDDKQFHKIRKIKYF